MEIRLSEIIDACKSAGEFIRKESGNFNREDVEEKKRFSDLVSYVDKTAEKQLVAHLGKVMPSAGFIAEEGTGEPKQGYNWIIDPLDGTTNFIHGLPAYSVSVALHDANELVAGVVYEITRDECFYAELGGGAYLNDDKIHVSPHGTLSDSLIATGFPYYEFDKLDPYIEILKDFMRTTQGVRRVGSAAVDLAYTAAGRFEGYYEFNLNSWDIAAGALLVREAGGVVTDFEGNDEFLFDRNIVAAGAVHPEMLTLISRYW